MELAFKAGAVNTASAATIKARRQALLVLVHIVSWFVFLSIPAVFNPMRHGIGIMRFIDDLMEPPRWTNGLLLVIVFYFNYYVAIPVFYMRRRYVLLGASVILWFCAFFLLNYSLTPPEVIRASNGTGFEALGNSFNLFMFMIVYATSFAVCLYEQWQKTREEKLNTEIQFLKSQINPHFLFNTLNSIYSLTLTNPDRAPDAVMKLSGMMRYTVTDTDQSFVPLTKELGYIVNYIELQKLRLSGRVRIHCDIPSVTDDMPIAPFLLIPFVENAFKYGVNSDEESDIRIKVDVGDNYLHLDVTNRKVYIRPDKDHSTGLGISTTRRRLQLLYPGRHVLSVTDNERQFIVSLYIQLHDHRHSNR